MSIFSRRVLLGMPLLAAGCTQARMLAAVDALTSDSGSLKVAGAAFGPHPRQKLDLYAPPDARDRPVVLFLYGGGWRQGDRAAYRFVAEALVARGMVAIIADYRLAPEAKFPDFVEDFALAAGWAKQHAAEHGGDPRKLAVLGHSAGAYNALVGVLDPSWLAGVGMQPRAIAQLVALAPPTGLELPRSRRLAPVFAAADPPGSAWPIRLASTGASEAPPITLVGGAADFIIQPADVRALGAAIQAGGGRAETLILPEAGHVEVLGDLWWGSARAEAWVPRLIG
jgi:acetyl esterase/lipase